MKENVSFSGRVKAAPNQVLYETILKPQFDYELIHLLPFYILIEKVNVNEAYSLGFMPADNATKIISILNQIDADVLQADRIDNLSDISFAIEQIVTKSVKEDLSTWHIDKSRNDFQACAQRMLARQQILNNIHKLHQLIEAIITLAENTLNLIMPGYTHYQAAQIISPGFYLAAVSESVLCTLNRLLHVYDELNCCPLGAGAMAGLEYPWNRERMAEQLGFDRPVRSALTSVADRDWILKISFEYALFGTAVSRYCTDLSLWGSSEYSFIDLPDDLASISSAMPQKRNFTILERIRGATAHLAGFHFDFMMGQRNTPYTNLVEVSKEATRYLISLFEQADLVVTLLTLVMEHLKFGSEQMRLISQKHYFGGFALANILTLQSHIPYRVAQVIAGEFIQKALVDKVAPAALDIAILKAITMHHGYNLNLDQLQLHQLFSEKDNLTRKMSAGSTHPVQVKALLAEQKREYSELASKWKIRQEYLVTTLEARTGQYEVW